MSEVKWNFINVHKACMLLTPTFSSGLHLLHVSPTFSHHWLNRISNTCASCVNNRSATELNKNTGQLLGHRLRIGVPWWLPVFCCVNKVIFPSPVSMGQENKAVRKYRRMKNCNSNEIYHSMHFTVAPVSFSLSWQCSARKLYNSSPTNNTSDAVDHTEVNQSISSFPSTSGAQMWSMDLLPFLWTFVTTGPR